MIDLLRFLLMAIAPIKNGHAKRMDSETELYRVSVYRVNTIIRIDLEPWNTEDPKWNPVYTIREHPDGTRTLDVMGV